MKGHPTQIRSMEMIYQACPHLLGKTIQNTGEPLFWEARQHNDSRPNIVMIISVVRSLGFFQKGT